MLKKCNGMSSARTVAYAYTVAIDANKGRTIIDIEGTGLLAASAEHASRLAIEEEAAANENAEQPHPTPIKENEVDMGRSNSNRGHRCWCCCQDDHRARRR